MRGFGSKLITRYLEAFTLVDGGASGVELEIAESARREVEALKLLVRVFVIRRPGLAVVQRGQDRVIRGLFRKYYEVSEPGSRETGGCSLRPRRSDSRTPTAHPRSGREWSST